jgi:hypothetical protein
LEPMRASLAPRALADSHKRLRSSRAQSGQTAQNERPNLTAKTGRHRTRKADAGGARPLAPPENPSKPQTKTSPKMACSGVANKGRRHA